MDDFLNSVDRLFAMDDPAQAPEGGTWLDNLNADSLEVLQNCKFEPALGDVPAGGRIQFERLGYFAADPDGATGKPVFNRAVGLKDSYAKAK